MANTIVFASVAELAYAQRLERCLERVRGSSPLGGTNGFPPKADQPWAGKSLPAHKKCGTIARP